MGNERHDITVEALTKRFGRVEAVRGISFSVRKGEVFGILGPNGAGKTTTIECIEGLLEPTSGRTTVLGLDSQRDGQEIKQHIGVQLQASAYFDYLTLREILDLFGRFYRQRVQPDELLTNVALIDKADTTVGKLSGGQKQRFAIAATLVNDPEVIFLDEPTSGLDPQARHNLWDLIRAMNKEGRTVVLTTHYMEEAQSLCDRVAIMDQGLIVALDTPAALVRTLPAPYEVEFTVDGRADRAAFESLDGVVSVTETGAGYSLRSSDTSRTLPALFGWASGARVRLDQLEVKPATLEDVFLSLTGKVLPD